MQFPLPKQVRFIIEEYERHGYAAHVVGGPVRDFLLGTTPHDYDLTTDATPEETKAVFVGERIIETGIKHGTVTLLLSDTPYEITTYRIDGEYLDNRRPESVTFTRSLAEDLSRRDFTVNAMAYTPREGIVDLFGGQEDLERRVLRTVGKAEDRFHEDALRILRALRFSGVLGFSIEENTARAIHSCAHLMKNLAVERVLEELIKLLDGKNAASVIREYAEPLSLVLPELGKAFSMIEALPQIPEEFSRTERFSARLAWISSLCQLDTEAYRTLCERLHTSREVREIGSSLLAYLDCRITTDYDLLLLLRHTSPTVARLMLYIKSISNKEREAALCRLDALLLQKRPYNISSLAIGGAELLRLGFSGKEIGKTLEKLLDAVMHGRVNNEKEELLSFLKR